MNNKSQLEEFMNGEADEWFRRNLSKLNSQTLGMGIEDIERELFPFKNDLNKILEIGCANGINLQRLATTFESTEAHGIDPSQIAIADGNLRFNKKIHLIRGSAQKLPYPTEFFDLVFFGFCLMYVDRNNLLQVVSEADRVLHSKGYLAILDFDVNSKKRNPYIHKKGLYSYKMNYPEIFISSGNYHMVYKKSFSHENNWFSYDIDKRVSVTILYKENSL